MSEPTTDRRRERLWDGWAALRNACRAQHPRGPGAAMMCSCGAGGGGSAACGMLATLRDLIRNLPDEALPAGWREHLDRLRAVIH